MSDCLITQIKIINDVMSDCLITQINDVMSDCLITQINDVMSDCLFTHAPPPPNQCDLQEPITSSSSTSMICICTWCSSRCIQISLDNHSRSLYQIKDDQSQTSSEHCRQLSYGVCVTILGILVDQGHLVYYSPIVYGPS